MSKAACVYPVVRAGKDEATRDKIQVWANAFSPDDLPPLELPFFASACDCNIKVASAMLPFSGKALVKVFGVAPLVGTSVVREEVTVSAALVRASLANVERAGDRYPSAVKVGRRKSWSKASTKQFAVEDAIECNERERQLVEKLRNRESQLKALRAERSTLLSTLREQRAAVGIGTAATGICL